MFKFNKPKITPSQLSLFTEPITDIYRALEYDVFNMIARRLITSADITSDTVFQWQADKLNQLRLVNEDTVKLLSKTTGLAKSEIRNAIKQTGVVTIESVDHELKNIYPKIPIPNDLDLRLETFVMSTFKEFDNFINQSLITSSFGTGTVTDMYRKVFEQSTAKVLAGTKTVNQAVAETMINWANKGLNTGFIDKGGNVWGLDRYAESTIRTTTNNVYNEVRVGRMKEYGMNLVLVSSLPDPREACSHIQGNIASLDSITDNKTKHPSVYEFGFGEPWGLRGVNCRHMFFPHVEGVSTNNQRQYTDKEVKYNREQRQKQRYYERQIRKAKQSLGLAKVTKDESIISKQSKLLRDRQSRMRDFIKETGRTRQYNREKVY